MAKIIIYQLFPRTFTNYCENRVFNGSIEQNGCGKLNYITDVALKEIKDLGATHIWYTGIIEHATKTDYTKYGIQKDNDIIVKGRAGSPYAIKDYYDIDPDLAVDIDNRMQEAEDLFERTHKAGLKIVLDFVGNHVARQYKSDAKPKDVEDLGEKDHSEWAFSPLNNFYYIPNQEFNTMYIRDNNQGDNYKEYPARVTGNDCFNSTPTKNDWYETIKLNYGVFYRGGMEKQFNPIPNTWKKMLDILLFWAKKGVDAFRCDMAEMVPVEFWGWAIENVKKEYPHIKFIAEVYNPSLYRSYIFTGKFDYLYDKVGMYDYLRGVTSKDYSAEGITQQWQSTEDIRQYMLYFLENHDEQRIASGFFCGSGICAEPAMMVATLLGNNPMLIYAGQELGENGMDAEGFSGLDGKTSIFDYWGIKSLQLWANKGKFDGFNLSKEQKELRLFYKKLLNIANNEKAIYDGLMFDLQYVQHTQYNRQKQYAFLRKKDDDIILIIVNFDDKFVNIKVNIPKAAFTYLEMKENKSARLIDLINKKEYSNIEFSEDSLIEFNIDAWKGLILKVI